MAFSGFRQEPISCSLAEIDFADRQYPFSYGRDDGRLRQSVVREGVVQPPLLAAGAAGLVIVCGRRRLEALRQVWGTAAGKIEAWLAVDADPAALCLHALWENAGHRQFNPVEAADIFTVLEKLLPAAALGDEILGVLGLPPKAKFLRRCRVIAAMEDEVRRRLAAGLLDGETVDLLADWPAADRRELLALAEELTLNRNRLREIARLAANLAGRDGETPAAVLRRTREALSASWPVTGGEFHQRLRRQLYPHLEAARERFAAYHRSLALPEQVKLSPPPDFEGNEYRLEVKFHNLSEWQAARRALLALADERINVLFS